MTNRRQWLTGAGVGFVTAALLVSGLSHPRTGARLDVASLAGTASAGSPAAGGAGAVGAGGPGGAAPWYSPMGAFTDSGAEGVERITALESWLGGTEMRVGHTYLPGDDWSGIEGGGGMLQPWADWKRANPDRLFVLNVPMQEHNEDHLDDEEVRGLIQDGAAGRFDVHFAKLARKLVDLGVPDTVIVLGWEMNGTTYSHRCGPDPTDWKTYWNRIVATMRAVPGQHFKFDFTPNRGEDAIGWTECYPGDDTVDIIGMDSYDQPPGDTFDDQVTEPYGLQAQVDFAAEHKKALSYPEWGLFRNGDNPDYMRLMLEWFDAHKPMYQTITDYCPHGVWQCTENPKSSKVYRTMLFDRKTAPDPVPTPTVTPTPTPAPVVTPTVPVTPTPEPVVTPTATPTPTVTPTATPTPEVTPTPTVSPTPTVTPAGPPIPAPAPEATPVPTAPPAPGQPPVPVPAPVPGPVPTAAPTAVPAPAAAPGPTPPPQIAPAPQQPVGPSEACMPMQLSEEMKKQYISGQVCIRLEPKPVAPAT